MAITCKSCGATLIKQSKYCPECGQPLESACPNCGAVVTGMKFCPECGTELNKTSSDTSRNSIQSSSGESGGNYIKDILIYLSMIIDMEQSVFIQENLLSNLRSKSDALCRRTMPSKPKEMEITTDGKQSISRGIKFIVGAIILGAIATTFFDGVGTGFFGSILCIIAFGCGVYGARCIITASSNTIQNKKIEKENDIVANNYLKHMEEYNHQMDKKKARKVAIDSSVQKVETELKTTRSDLNKLYDMDIVYSAYRGWANVCSLYDYIASGMCKTLEEAYKVLVAHIDAGEIITRLDRIVLQLNAIKSRQATLYNSIQDANKTMDRLVNSTDEIANQLESLNDNTTVISEKLNKLEQTSALSAYYEERNNIQLKYMNQKNYYSANYANRTFINDLPPD